MKKSWLRKGISIVLAGSMVFSMAACSNRDEEQQALNNAEAKKYVFECEELDLGLSEYDYYGVNSMEYKNGKLYLFAHAEKYEPDYVSKQMLIMMNPDGSDREEFEIKPPVNEEVMEGGAITDDMLRSSMPVVIPEEEPVVDEDFAVDMPTEESPDYYDMTGEVVTYRSYGQMKMGSANKILCIELTDTTDYTIPEAPVYSNEQSLVCLDLEGNEIWRAPLKLYAGEEEYFYAQTFLTDEQGNSYIISRESCITFDRDGNHVAAVKMEQSNYNSIFVSEEGDLQVVFWNEDYSKQNIAKLNPKTGAVEDIEALPDTIAQYNIYKGYKYDLMLTNTSGIFGYNLGDEEVTQIMSYINSDLCMTYLNEFFFIAEGQFVASYWDEYSGKYQVALFTAVDPEDIPDKQGIIFGCNYVDYEVRNRIVEFNKESDEYRIVIKEYSNYNSPGNWQAGVTQLNNDILSGNIPDILVISRDMPVESYANKGIFADLYEFLEEDEELNREDYLQNVLDAYTIDGELYAVVPSFSVETCTAKSEWVEQKESWSIQEMQEVVAKMPEGASAFGESYGRESMLNIAMSYTSDQFIDWESGKCNMDSEEFKALLSYIATYPAEESMVWDEDYWMNEYEVQWHNDKTLMMSTSIYSIADFDSMNSAYLDEDYSIVGFPCAPEMGAVLSANTAYAISEKSNNKEVAWEFIRYYLTDEYQQTIQWSLPVNEEALYQQAMEATKKPVWIDEFGNETEYDQTYWIAGQEIIIEPMTEAEVEELLEYIKSVKNTWSYKEDILEIINEEAAPFFEGQKSVDEVVKIIQSRVQLYVDENR